MKELRMVEVEQAGWYEYHLAAERDQFLAYTTQHNVALEQFADGSGLSEADVYGAYRLDRGHFSDNYLLYYRIISAFLTHPVNYAICFQSKAEAENAFGGGVEACNWKYQIEYYASNDGQRKGFSDWGFLEPGEFITAAGWQRMDNRGYYLKRIGPLDVLHSFSLLSSDVTSWNFVSLSNAQESRFLDGMQGAQRPRVQDVLGEDTILIGLQLGLDEGYCDYMVIKSSKRLREKAAQIEKDVNERGKLYEDRLREVYFWEYYPYLLKEAFDLPLLVR